MNVDAYLDLPYRMYVDLRDDGDGEYWFATVAELPGCMSDGDTVAEARAALRDAMHGWIGAAIEDGRQVPQPSDGHLEPDR